MDAIPHDSAKCESQVSLNVCFWMTIILIIILKVTQCFVKRNIFEDIHNFSFTELLYGAAATIYINAFIYTLLALNESNITPYY